MTGVSLPRAGLLFGRRLISGLLLLSFHAASAQVVKPIPPPQQISTFEVYDTPISDIVKFLSRWTPSKIVLDSGVTGRVTGWVQVGPDTTFDAVLRKVLAEADQPLTFTLRDGAYHIGVMHDLDHWKPPYWARAEQNARLVRRRLSVSPRWGTSTFLVDASGPTLQRFPVRSGIGSGPPLPGVPYIFGGTVAITPLVPVTGLRVVPSAAVRLSGGSEGQVAVFQSQSPAFDVYVLFDAVGATKKIRGDETEWTDKQGHQVIVYTAAQ